VSYGRVANNLPKYAPVVNLLKQNGITMVRIYDADSGVLTALANTGIKVMVMVPNEEVADLASSPSNALQWVRDNVAAYRPSTQIHAVAVGNEVFDSRPDLNSALVPAMTNVQAGLAQLNLAGDVKVTTPLAFSAVSVSWPPAAGKFRDDIAQSVMKPMLDLLQRTGSYLSVNYYPYLTYMAQPESFTLDYVLANNNAGVLDPNSQLRYYNLLDAQRDATYYAMQKLGPFSNLAVHHTEHGAPSGGGLKPGGGGRRLLQTGAVASVANAQTYINNLMNRVLSGKTGTPYRPDADMDVYIFALFNENNKGTGADDVEQHFGLFYPNMEKVYEFDFTHIINGGGGGGGGGGQKDSWCVANAAVGDARLKDALDYACGHGADCSSLQPGGSCYEPNTMAAHASYAFNSYYQAMNRAPGACDFNGAASVVYDKPAGESYKFKELTLLSRKCLQAHVRSLHLCKSLPLISPVLLPYICLPRGQTRAAARSRAGAWRTPASATTG
jgi:exo-beta-1,3-glucanase (GH17 family)